MEMFSMKAILIVVFLFLFFYLIFEMCRYEAAPVVSRGAEFEYDLQQRMIILDRLLVLRDEDLLQLKGDIVNLNKALENGAPAPSGSGSKSDARGVALASAGVPHEFSASQVLRDINKDIKRLPRNGNRDGDIKMAQTRVFLIITLLFLVNVLLVLL